MVLEWIDYKDGDDLPSSIDIKFRNGDIWFNMIPALVWWDHNGQFDDIVAYRISVDKEGLIREQSV